MKAQVMFRVPQFLFLAALAYSVVCIGNTRGEAVDKGHQTKIVAHRGDSWFAPENTVVSMKLAIEKKAEILELDTSLSKDKRVMVIHDDTTKRTAGVDLVVEETDSAKLRQLDVGSWKGPEYAGAKMPFLEEIIEILPKGTKLFIDAKYNPAIAPYLKKIIDAGGKKDQMMIASIKWDVVVACQKEMPDVPVYWGIMTDRDKTTKQFLPYDPAVIDKAVAHGFAGFSLHHKGLTKDFVAQARKAGLEVIVWTVDGVTDAKRLAGYHVDAIATNRPGVIKAAITDR